MADTEPATAAQHTREYHQALLVTEPPTAAPLYDETRCHAERHIGPAGMKVVVWCDKDTGHKGQHRNEQQGIFWSGNDA